MKNFILSCIVGLTFLIPATAQEQAIQEKLRKFFFNLPFGADVEVIRTELKNNPNFKFYQDPNRDAQKTITGTILQDSNLNPIASSNQVIILYSSAEVKKTKKVSLKWSMNYKIEDLASALVDFEKLKSEYTPLFIDFSERIKTGQQKEQVHTMVLKYNSITVTIRLIKFNNYGHTLSLEYRDTWKIKN